MSVAIALILCNIATVVLGILTIIYSIRLKRLRSVRWLLVLTISFLISSIFTVISNVSQNFEDKVFFFQLRSLGMAFFPPLWLYFIAAVSNRWNWLHNKWVTFFVFLPNALNFVLMLFPSTALLFFRDLTPLVYKDVTVVKFAVGPGYQVVYAWSMLLLLSSYVVTVIVCVKEKGFRRRQVLILNFGLSAALLAYFFFDAETIKWVVSGSLSVLCTQDGIMYAVVRYRLFSIIPLAVARVFQQFPDPVLVLDDEDRIMGASNQAVLTFGLPKNFLGRNVKELMPTLSKIPGEISIEAKDKKNYDYHLAVEQVTDDHNHAAGTVLFFRDIKQQKSTQQSLNESLEFRSRLLAFLAHDLMGFTENQAIMSTALQKVMPEEHQHHLNLINHSATASQELITNIMGWVKTQSLRFEPIKNDFEWNALLKDIFEQLKGHLNQKNIQIVFTSVKNPLLAKGDSEMLAAVFRNILMNAVRATPKEKCIYVDLEEIKQEIRIKIRDEGYGIEPIELERIRQATETFQLTGVSKAKNFGLGLMIARHFIFLHQGRFEIHSQLNSGTEVVIAIPL